MVNIGYNTIHWCLITDPEKKFLKKFQNSYITTAYPHRVPPDVYLILLEVSTRSVTS